MSNSTTSDAKLGTFLGVFTPTILTILGVIMYLRVGWLVGHLGLVRVVAVVLLAHAITLTTTLAFSAVATNARVGVGGAYFIISRSLGLELGGAIGVPLFLSQVFSVTLYAYGLAESFRIVWPQLPLMPTAFVVVIGVWVLAITGAEKALRAQVVLMGFVVLSLIALAVGAFHRTSRRRRDPPCFEWPGRVLAGICGLLPGGDGGDGRPRAVGRPARSRQVDSLGFHRGGLRRSRRLLGRATLLVMGASADDLRNEPLVWSKIAILGPWLVLPGLWSAIFSSAVGSVLAAPRTLQALARDGLAPKVLGRRTGDAGELLPGMLVTLCIAVGAVFLGNLNAVAAVVSMFFLTVYGTVNIAASFEILSGDPSWRPKIKVPWWLTLFVGLACGAVMVLINPLAGAVALAAELSCGRCCPAGDSGRGGAIADGASTRR